MESVKLPKHCPPYIGVAICKFISNIKVWYPRPDSNRHDLSREILSLLCLPFHHLGNLFIKDIIQYRALKVNVIIFVTKNIYVLEYWYFCCCNTATFNVESQNKTASHRLAVSYYSTKKYSSLWQPHSGHR